MSNEASNVVISHAASVITPHMFTFFIFMLKEIVDIKLIYVALSNSLLKAEELDTQTSEYNTKQIANR